MKIENAICEGVKINIDNSEVRFIVKKDGVKDQPGKITASKVLSILFDTNEANIFDPGISYLIEITEIE